MKNEFDAAMARINYRYVRQPDEVTEEKLRDFERDIGHPLPADYRAFLMKYGFAAGRGGTRLTDTDEPEAVGTSVGVFYGLKVNDKYDLRRIKSTFADRLPNHLLPITSGSGGEFCLSLSGDNAGRVYWWFQENGQVESMDDLEPISDSFRTFIDNLSCADE